MTTCIKCRLPSTLCKCKQSLAVVLLDYDTKLTNEVRLTLAKYIKVLEEWKTKAILLGQAGDFDGLADHLGIKDE